MRVLHVQRVKGIGGSERHLLALLPALRQRGCQVRMCVLAVEDAPRFVEQLRASDIDVTVRWAHRSLAPTLTAALASEMRDFRPDVVHTHLIHADVHGLVAARARSIPTVSSMHGTPAFYRRQPVHAVGFLTGRLARRRIAISEHVAAFVRELHLAPDDRIRVVHYGIDTSVGAPCSPTDARAVFGLRPDEVAVGIASRLIPGKGHDVLLEAFARSATGRPGLRLLVAGDGPERVRLEEIARDRCPPGVVRFLGFVDDIAAFMTACDVLAFPTQPVLGEGFGLAALEAMAAGRPVIASAVASLPEVVADDITGVLVTPDSIDGFEAAISRLADDARLRTRLGVAAAERAGAVFPLSAMVDRTVAVYEELR